MTIFLDRIPVDADLRYSDFEVHVLDALRCTDGGVLLGSQRIDACGSEAHGRRVALELLEAAVDGSIRNAVGIVLVRREAPLATRRGVIAAYDVAVLRALFEFFDLLGRSFCPTCRAENNIGDVECYRCGRAIASTEAA